MSKKPFIYDGFISYRNSATQTAIAEALQSGLRSFARPFWKARALRIFRDATNLSAGNHLKAAIFAALDVSHYFLFLATPEARDRPWIDDEIKQWLRKERGVERIILVLTDGQLVWDRSASCYDDGPTNALPPALLTCFEHEPLHVDLSWAKDPKDLSLRDPRFADAVATIASTLHGKNKDELIGQEVRLRRQIRLTLAAVIAVLLILAAALTAAFIEMRASRAAEHEARLRADDQAERTFDASLLGQALLLLDQHKFGPALRLLEAVRRPAARLEWRQIAWSALAHAPRFTAGAPGAPVLDARWSPDGRRVALAFDDEVIIRQADGAGPRLHLTAPHSLREYSLNWSPDGNWIAAIGNYHYREGEVLVWSRHDSGPPQSFGEEVTRLAWSPDGRYLAATVGPEFNNHGVLVWDPEAERIVQGFGSEISELSWSPDSRYLLAWAEYRPAWVWDAHSRVVRELGTWIHSVHWLLGGDGLMDTERDRLVVMREGKHLEDIDASPSPDGRRLLLLLWSHDDERDPEIVVRDLVSGNDIKPPGFQDIDPEWVHWRADGRLVAAAVDDRLRVLDVETGVVEVMPLAWGPGSDKSWDAAWSHDGLSLALHRRDRPLTVWTTNDHPPSTTTSATDQEPFQWTLSWSPDDTCIILRKEEETDVHRRNGTLLLELESTDWRWLPTGAVLAHNTDSPGGTTLQLLRPDGSFERELRLPPTFEHLWNPSGDVIHRLQGAASVHAPLHGPDLGDSVVLLNHRHAITEADWSPDGLRIITASEDGRAIVWDALTGTVRFEIDLGAEVWSASWDPRGAHILTASKDGMVRVWRDYGDRAERVSELKIYTPSQWQDFPAGAGPYASWSPRGDAILVAGSTGSARLWWPMQGEGDKVDELTPGDAIHRSVVRAFWSPDGRQVAFLDRGEPGGTWVWSIGAGPRKIGIPGAFPASWSPNGEYLAIQGFDSAVWLWSSQSAGKRIPGLNGRPSWSPDSRRLAVDSKHVLTIANVHGEILATGVAPDWLVAHAWDPEGRYILAGTSQGQVLIWELLDADTLGEPVRLSVVRRDPYLAPPGALDTRVKWSPDGKRFLAFSDINAQVWPWDIELIKDRMQRANIDCLPARMRELYLLEDARAAEAGYEACESR